MNGLINWSKIDAQIDVAKDLKTIANMHDQLEAIKALAKQQDFSLATVNKCAVYKFRLEQKAGAIYAAMKSGRKGTGSNQYQSRTLPDETTSSTKQQAEKDTGKSRKTLGQWAKEAEISDEKVLEYEARCNDKEKEFTSAGAYRAATKTDYDFSYADLPAGKHHVIYADPPWYISNSEWHDKWGGAFDTINEKYSRIKTEDLYKLPVPGLAADSCVLFLWTTHTFLPEAFAVAEAWGFKYNSLITWDKGSGWTTQKFHRSTEFCLYCLRGPINYKGEAFPALIQEKKTEHSKKPQIMRELIEARIPEPRVELFARKEYPGWVSWGNQL